MFVFQIEFENNKVYYVYLSNMFFKQLMPYLIKVILIVLHKKILNLISKNLLCFDQVKIIILLLNRFILFC